MRSKRAISRTLSSSTWRLWQSFSPLWTVLSLLFSTFIILTHLRKRHNRLKRNNPVKIRLVASRVRKSKSIETTSGQTALGWLCTWEIQSGSSLIATLEARQRLSKDDPTVKIPMIYSQSFKKASKTSIFHQQALSKTAVCATSYIITKIKLDNKTYSDAVEAQAVSEEM